MNIGFAEGLVIALIAVLLIKPEELRVAARTAGRWMREMRKMSNEFMSELSREADLSDLREETKKIEQEIGSMDVSDVDEQMENYLQGDVEGEAPEDERGRYEEAENDMAENDMAEDDAAEDAATEHEPAEQEAVEHEPIDASGGVEEIQEVRSQGE